MLSEQNRRIGVTEDGERVRCSVPGGGQWHVYSHHAPGIPRLYNADDPVERQRFIDVATVVVEDYFEDVAGGISRNEKPLDEVIAEIEKYID